MTKKKRTKKQRIIFIGRILLIIGAVLLIIGTFLYVIQEPNKEVKPVSKENVDPNYNNYFDRDINEDLKNEVCHNNICTNNLVIQDLNKSEVDNIEIVSFYITNNSDIDLINKHLVLTFKESNKKIDIEFSLNKKEFIELEYQTKEYELINSKSYDFIIE